MSGRDEKSRSIFVALEIWILLCSVAATIPNLSVFLLLSVEQIRTGWGYPTNYEMAVLGFWLWQILTVPLALVSGGGCVWSLVRRAWNGRTVANAVTLLVTLLAAAFSVLFEYY